MLKARQSIVFTKVIFERKNQPLLLRIGLVAGA